MPTPFSLVVPGWPGVIGSNVSYSVEAETLFAAMTTQPSAARKSLIDRTIKSLKSAGIWSKLDCLYVLAAADSQSALLNWKNPGTFTAIAVNSPTFTTDRGYTGDGATSRLRTQFTPSTNGVNYTQNSASAWVWSLTDSQSGQGAIGNITAPSLFINSRNLGGSIVVDVNDGTGSTATISASSGLTGASRVSSTVKRAWRNGVQQGSDFSVASTGLPTQEQWICGANSSSFSTRQIAAAAWAASLSGLELSFYNTLLAYMQGVGAA